MKILFDLFPVILLFGVFKLANSNPDTAQAFATAINYQVDPQHLPILLATATAILATIAQIIWVKWRHGKVDTMLWISFVIIAVFGGATLALHDEAFIKIKPTALYWLFALVMLFSNFLFKKNLIRSMMQEKMELPDRVWGQMNLAWSGLFIALGVLNLYVAWNYPTDTWVNFKLFGVSGIMFVFIILQAILLSKYLDTSKKENN
jgi:intracellular septation protein